VRPCLADLSRRSAQREGGSAPASRWARRVTSVIPSSRKVAEG